MHVIHYQNAAIGGRRGRIRGRTVYPLPGIFQAAHIPQAEPGQVAGGDRLRGGRHIISGAFLLYKIDLEYGHFRRSGYFAG